jgi:hypothetical protein
MLDAHSRTAYGSALVGTFGVEEAHITEAPGTHSEKSQCTVALCNRVPRL